jgi:hypothetical protein
VSASPRIEAEVYLDMLSFLPVASPRRTSDYQLTKGPTQDPLGYLKLANLADPFATLEGHPNAMKKKAKPVELAPGTTRKMQELTHRLTDFYLGSSVLLLEEEDYSVQPVEGGAGVGMGVPPEEAAKRTHAALLRLRYERLCIASQRAGYLYEALELDPRKNGEIETPRIPLLLPHEAHRLKAEQAAARPPCVVIHTHIHTQTQTQTRTHTHNPTRTQMEARTHIWYF